jgi:hypothetical protein
VGSGAQRGRGGPGGRAGWDALLAAVRRGVGERGHRGAFEGQDVSGVADGGAGPGGASWWRAMMIPPLVASSMLGAPSRWVTVTGARASSGGTE